MTTCDLLRRVGLGSLALVVLQTAPAAAQGTAQDQATARTLFNESRRLMKAERYEEACRKLEGASRLYPGSGVLLNLGDCYEHIGRMASAWTEFGEAASAADRTSRPDDAAEARRRQALVEPKVPHLVIRIARVVPGLVVKRDATPIDRVAWGESIPLDPGTHTISAEGDGYVPWKSAVAVSVGGKVSIDVPELAALPEASPPSSQPPPPDSLGEAPPPPHSGGYWTGRRIAGATLTGIGVIGAGVGAALVVVAKANDTAAENETTGTHRHADSVDAVSLGNVGSVVLVGGAVVAIAGVTLWLTAPSAPVRVGTNGREIILAGSF